MQFVNAADFTADRAWGALDLARIPDATVRLHWTDEPYVWHVNDGTEAFIVVDGIVDMHVRTDGEVTVHELTPGTVFVAETGDEVAGLLAFVRRRVLPRGDASAGDQPCSRGIDHSMSGAQRPAWASWNGEEPLTDDQLIEAYRYWIGRSHRYREAADVFPLGDERRFRDAWSDWWCSNNASKFARALKERGIDIRSDEAALRQLAKKAGKSPTTVVSIGYVQQSGSSSNDRSLSTMRARAAAAYLAGLGVTSTYTVRGEGVGGADPQARKVVVTVTRAQ